MLYMIERDSLLVKMVADRSMECTATCQISKIDVKPKYTNIAIQKITILINGRIKHIDHLWLQEQDYPSSLLDIATEGKWVDIDFIFYPYRDKITKNKDGIKMHGMHVLRARETEEYAIPDQEKIWQCEEAKQFKFNEF